MTDTQMDTLIKEMERVSARDATKKSRGATRHGRVSQDTARKGEIIFEQGDHGDFFYVLEKARPPTRLAPGAP